jgi:hypothetical protein
MFRAIAFTVMDCGFEARCALEEDNANKPRYHKLIEMIGQCPYGIHDISRTQLDPLSRLPRFNMPLELGLFMGASAYGVVPKQCLILEKERYRYQKFISDISGNDVSAHHDKPRLAIVCVRDWLVQHRREVVRPTGDRIWNKYRLFTKELPRQCERQNLTWTKLTFSELIAQIQAWLTVFDETRRSL